MPGFPLLPSTKKARRLLPAKPWRHAEFVLRVGQSGGVDRRRNHRGPLFLRRYLRVSKRRQVAMQQQRDPIERENPPCCEKCGRLFGIREHTLSAEDLEDIRTNERHVPSITYFLPRYCDRT